jgi:predicted O-linked N-acetylglucosamine transferase (SPINDLY family)
VSEALARRAASVQVCWLDYFCTTGVAAVDWYCSDEALSPPDGPQRLSEQLLRLSAGRLCHRPPAGAPAVTPRGPGLLLLASFRSRS